MVGKIPAWYYAKIPADILKTQQYLDDIKNGQMTKKWGQMWIRQKTSYSIFQKIVNLALGKLN